MSTRCQLRVIQEGLDGEDSVTLYHHYDGYPGHIVPEIAKARELAGGDRASGQAVQVAAHLCAAHPEPAGFELEDGHALHGDLDFYYRLFLVNTARGSRAEEPRWEVEISRVRYSSPSGEELQVVMSRRPLTAALLWQESESRREHRGIRTP